MDRTLVPVRRPEINLSSLTSTDSMRTCMILQLGMPRLAYKHCWDHNFCGEHFIQELAKLYYGRFTFVFRDTQHLPAFLGFEISGDKVSPLPGRYLSLEHVDKLVINLWRGSYLTISGAANVQALLKLERKANIEIILQGSSGLWWNVEAHLKNSVWINRDKSSCVPGVGHAAGKRPCAQCTIRAAVQSSSQYGRSGEYIECEAGRGELQSCRVSVRIKVNES